MFKSSLIAVLMTITQMGFANETSNQVRVTIDIRGIDQPHLMISNENTSRSINLRSGLNQFNLNLDSSITSLSTCRHRSFTSENPQVTVTAIDAQGNNRVLKNDILMTDYTFCSTTLIK